MTTAYHIERSAITKSIVTLTQYDIDLLELYVAADDYSTDDSGIIHMCGTTEEGDFWHIRIVTGE